MKRYISLILVFIMMLSVIGCGSTATTTTEKTKTTEKTSEPTSEPTANHTVDELKAAIASFTEEELIIGEIYNLADKSEKSYSSPDVKPISGHPRVLVTSDTLDTVKGYFHEAENENFYRVYASERDTEIALDKSHYKNSDIIKAKAFAYLAEGNETAGYEAIYMTLSTLVTFEENDSRYSGYESVGELFYTAGLVYDWCYDIMTATQREAIVSQVLNKVACHSEMEIGCPPDNQAAIASHGSEEQLLKHWLAFSIAVYDEYPEIYEFVGGRFWDEYVPARNYFYTTAGFVGQGTAYIATRYNNDMYSRLIAKAGLGVDPYDDSMVEVCRTLAYYIRPDYEMLRQGDDFNQKHAPYEMDDVTWTMWFSGNLMKDGIAKGIAKFYSKDYTRWICGTAFSAVETLVISDPTVEIESVESLGLVRYIATPFSRMIARTGWDLNDAPDGDWSNGLKSDDIIVHMNIGERYVTNHEWLDAGSFAVYYKGALAIDSGAYGSYREGQHLNYSILAVAHNCLLIKGEDNPSGNQTFLDESQAITLKMWKKYSLYETGKTLAHESKETDGKVKYAYLSGDIAQAYRKGQKKFAKQAIRSMLFMQADDSDTFAGVFFVFDNVIPKEGYDTTFLLHMEEEPTVEGNVSTILATREGANGKLVCQTLLPANPVFTLIGGEGQEFVNEGVNWEYTGSADLSNGSDLELGWGRIEITNADASDTDYFLNAMYVTEADNTAEMTPATLFENETHYAAKLGKYVAAFTKLKDKTADNFTLIIDGEGELVYAVTGVAAGEWTVTAGGASQTVTATEDGGILYFTASAGTVTFEKK